jgi:hypothetical protein
LPGQFGQGFAYGIGDVQSNEEAHGVNQG